MMSRAPIFELHIRPLFRLVDRVHMLRIQPAARVDLWDYNEVRAHAGEILTQLASASPMPPQGIGGPWPEEWIALFSRWTTTGYQRLEETTGANYQLTVSAPGRYVLSCDARLSETGAAAWFEIIEATPDTQRYHLVLERVAQAPQSPSVVLVEERIRGPLNTNSVIVIDQAGQHVLPVPP
jgi:hypothetical protein